MNHEHGDSWKTIPLTYEAIAAAALAAGVAMLAALVLGAL